MGIRRKKINGRYPRRRPEQILHIQIAEALPHFLKPEILYWHTPNQGYRHIGEAAQLQRMGVRAGVADLCFVMPPMGRMVFIELKAGKSTQSEAQIQFEKDATLAGAVYTVCRSFPEVIGFLRTLGAVKEGVHIDGIS